MHVPPRALISRAVSRNEPPIHQSFGGSSVLPCVRFPPSDRARVILACRDLTRAQKAASDITNSTGNSNVVVYKLDLSSLKSVRECAEEVKKNEQRLDILINNAGVMWTPQCQTEDGFDMQMGTNHLGHFLFTNSLLDLVKKSAPSRIVTVASRAHERANFDIEDINSERSFSTMTAYSNSKLANILFTRELAKRLEGTNVTAVSLHPGVIATELTRHANDKNIATWVLMTFLFNPFLQHLIKTPTAGAQTTLYCALDPDVENHPGKYFSDCAVKEPTKAGQDDIMASKLWTLSEKLTGLNNQVLLAMPQPVHNQPSNKHTAKHYWPCLSQFTIIHPIYISINKYYATLPVEVEHYWPCLSQLLLQTTIAATPHTTSCKVIQEVLLEMSRAFSLFSTRGRQAWKNWAYPNPAINGGLGFPQLGLTYSESNVRTSLFVFVRYLLEFFHHGFQLITHFSKSSIKLSSSFNVFFSSLSKTLFISFRRALISAMIFLYVTFSDAWSFILAFLSSSSLLLIWSTAVGSCLNSAVSRMPLARSGSPLGASLSETIELVDTLRITTVPVAEGHTYTAAKFLVVITADLQLVAMLVTPVHGEPRPLLNVSTSIHCMFVMISIILDMTHMYCVKIACIKPCYSPLCFLVPVMFYQVRRVYHNTQSLFIQQKHHLSEAGGNTVDKITKSLQILH
ncbi:RDH14-like protein [Mya arenaria]|uniref:RDH14-like protein n=1 Tax=Mya arenaria TaxID=6604 RepID=A0ABY7FBC4_MYAAR|nr:RDH14-like protein [Mya arenaria]